MKFEYEVTNLNNDEVIILTLDPMELDRKIMEVTAAGVKLCDIGISLVEAE